MWRQWSAPHRYVLASVAVGHPIVAISFREAIDALLAQGFLLKDGTRASQVGPGLLREWIAQRAPRQSPVGGSLALLDRPRGPRRPFPGQPRSGRWVHAMRAAAHEHRGDAQPDPSRGRIPRPVERRRAKLFCSYTHRDDRCKGRLERHLSTLRREDLVEIWHDQRIAPGEDWRARIGTRPTRAADVILLLISADFVASDFCFDIELAHAIERHQAGTARVIPIAVRSADWGNAALRVLSRALSAGSGQPIASGRGTTMTRGPRWRERSVRWSRCFAVRPESARRTRQTLVSEAGSMSGGSSTLRWDRRGIGVRIPRAIIFRRRAAPRLRGGSKVLLACGHGSPACSPAQRRRARAP